MSSITREVQQKELETNGIEWLLGTTKKHKGGWEMKNWKKWIAVTFCLVLVLTLCSVEARAESKEVRLMSWGGSIQKMFEEKGFAEKFEEQTGYKFRLIAKAPSAVIISTAIAQKDRPEVDVVMCDLGAWIRGRDLGIFAKLDPKIVTNLKDLYPIARIDDVGVCPYGEIMCILYHPEIFKEKGWPKPTSWEDILRPELAGMIAIPTIDNTFGLTTMVVLARLRGGGESNIEPGFEAEKELAPRVLTWEHHYSRLGQLFEARSIAMTVYCSSAAFRFKKRGLAVDHVYPEGSPLIPTTLGVMKGAPNPEGAQALANFLISSEFGGFRANNYGNIPLNRKASLDEDTAERLGIGEELFANLAKIDWSITNEHRTEWVERWEKEIATIKLNQ